jgi:nucleotide-binding universal stress UspA family protein
MDKSGNILIPVNLEDESRIALEQTYNVAKLFGLNITLLFVLEESGIWSKFFSDKQKKEMDDEIEVQLKDLALKTQKDSGCETNYLIRKGRVSTVILDIAIEIDAKYIFMRTLSSKEGEAKSLSANAYRVIRKAICPVVSINGKDYYKGCRSILLPLDLTNETMHKTTKAVEFAKYFDASINVVSVVRETGASEYGAKMGARMYQVKKFIVDSGISCKAKLIENKKKEDIVSAILKYAKKQGDIDLVMIMNQQEVGVTGMKIGVTAERFIKNCEIPLMTIKPFEMGNVSMKSF